jgi:hypothetical protein
MQASKAPLAPFDLIDALLDDLLSSVVRRWLTREGRIDPLCY